MSKFGKKILAIISICALLSSCVDEAFQKNKETVVDGIPVTATLIYNATGAVKVTKATEEEEKAVNDLFVILFDEAGNYSGHKFLDTEDLGNSKQITLETTSGSKRIYAVANLKSNSFTATSAGEMSLFKKVEDFVNQDNNQKNLQNWLAMSADMTQEQVTWGTGNFLMSGRFVSVKEDVGDGKCIFDIDGRLINAGEIKLERSVASIQFEISSGEGVRFTPTSWSVHNAPKSVYLYQKDGNPETASYFNTISTQVSNNKFNFYILENRQTAQRKEEFLQKLAGESNAAERADIRETYDKSKGEPVDETAKEYTYAPQNGTYIVLKGTFAGVANNPFNDDKPGNASAEVTYFIHLGYVLGDIPEADFDVMRNYKYTYKVKVVNINKIIVEAYKGDDTYRADGDVVFSDAEVIDLDAHYSRIKLTFKEGEELGDFLCNVSTAKTNFQDENVASASDIDWVQFIQTTDSKAESPNFTTQNGGPSTGLMTIKQLSEKFKNKQIQYVNGEASFYAYVKDNYYDDGTSLDRFINYDATTGAAKTRSMTIALRKGNHGNSSVSSARYIIRQKPIISVFNMGDSRVRSGQTWGVEWVNENEGNGYPTMSLEDKAKNGLEYGLEYGTSTTRSADDGLANMQADWKQSSIAWKHSDIQNKAYAACMSRNRDENGDGKITDNEIKWYLPAINQYQHLWVGMNAVPDDATLYPKEFRNANSWQLYHYYSNTTKAIFWAEEGAAVSLKGIDQANNTKKHIRCARNVGTGTKVAIAVKAESTTSVNNKKVREISVDYRLAPSALRNEYYGAGQLLIHNEYGEQNKVYRKFLVADENTYAVDESGNNAGAQQWINLANGLGIEIENNNGGKNICKEMYAEGWRAPSQRELILLTSIGGYHDNLFSSTYFSMYYDGAAVIKLSSPHPVWTGMRIGYRYSGGVVQLVTPDKKEDTLAIRCVKDRIVND